MAGVPVSMLIADDQDVLAAGMVAALDSLGEFELVGVAASPLEAGGWLRSRGRTWRWST